MSLISKSNFDESFITISKQNSKSSQNLKWFVFYTYPRAEKKVYNELMNRGYTVFLPTLKTLKVWKNRQSKSIEKVLFPNYIFVKIHICELNNIIQLHNVVSFVNCAGKPSIIKESEVDQIKTLLSLNLKLSVVNNFVKGEQIKVVSGPLTGYEGILIEQKGKTKFCICLSEINLYILIDTENNFLERKTLVSTKN